MNGICAIQGAERLAPSFASWPVPLCIAVSEGVYVGNWLHMQPSTLWVGISAASHPPHCLWWLQTDDAGKVGGE
jgi:hypothetical protein